MGKVKSVDWRAIRKTAVYTVEEQEVTFRKRGTVRLGENIASIPLLGDAIEYFVGAALKSEASTQVAIQKAIVLAAKDWNVDAGKVLRDLITSVPRLIVDIIVEDTILASEDEREPYREWVEQLGPSGLVDAVTGWVDLNMPEFRDPLVRGLTALLRQGGSIVKTLQDAANSPTTVDVKPSATRRSKPPAKAKASKPLKAAA